MILYFIIGSLLVVFNQNYYYFIIIIIWSLYLLLLQYYAFFIQTANTHSDRKTLIRTIAFQWADFRQQWNFAL